ncbi:hypothetical protein HPB49_022285 [Dermacentor silvarum]|uniref:Uncharacterized protein n=1 Tax=Dermacentor silvarum TaxID=543639 RepID=A0ACB8DGG3_DERSI|nr:hypothetical protein HPB49_022285 [Dermacentor silvarum]
MTLLSIGYLLETPGCSFPLYNPYHWSVSYRWERVNATNVTYEEICSARNRTVILQEGGKFSLDSIGLLLAYNATVQGTKCYYHVVSRDETAYIPDTKPILGPARSLPFGFSGPDAESLFKRYSFDTFPLLWNTFRLEGYTTLFLEEMPYYGLFTYPNYLGFNRPPTDYYPEPVLRMMDEKGGNDRFCVGSRLKTKVLIRYLADVLKMNVNRSMFSYVWLSDVTHNNLKGIKVIDQPLEEFFRQLSDAGIFENTAVLFLSDHGNRIGPYRMSEIGRHEDKTPFCFLILPRRFLQEYPEAVVQLEVNQRRLVTHYDLHATLLSLSKLPAFNPEPTNKGLNVFTAIPPERTCADAFIAPEFCACTGTTGETPDPGVMLSFSRYSVSYINALAMLHFPGKCIEWQLESVDEASALGGRVAGKLLLRVQLTLTPTAHFEVYGTLRNASLDDKHVDFVQRLDKYSNGTTCLPNSAWQKVCMCKPELLNISSTFQSPDSASLDDMAGS